MKRRDFIRHLLLGTTAPLGMLNMNALSADLHGDSDEAVDAATRFAKRRLVLVELAGANDGLNTLVPYRNDHYHNLRPTIGLHAKDVLALTDAQGLHKSLRPLMRHWERGDLAWIQGLGYPSANRSHFKSIALWETAGDGDSRRSDRGWITHAVEHQLARTVSDAHGISLAGDMGIFASDAGRWLSLTTTDQLTTERLPAAAAQRYTHPALALIQDRLQTLQQTLTQLSAKLTQVPDIPAFDAQGFGEQLRQIALLIAAGVDTPVYRVRLEGFDTHEYQSGRHAQLLDLLARGLMAFSDALQAMGEWQDTLLMSYSEFGRRAAENRSAGTDHGTAAPHLVMGGAVRGGLYGVAPDLADLPDGDPVYTLDYRALYQRMLRDGLGSRGALGALDDHSSDVLEELFRRA